MSNFDDKKHTGVTTLDPEERLRPAGGSEAESADSIPAAVEEVANRPPASFATRASVVQAEGISKSKLLVLGGGLAIAVFFFVFTAIVGKSPKKHQPSKFRSKVSRQRPSRPRGA